jgi:Putative sensor
MSHDLIQEHRNDLAESLCESDAEVVEKAQKQAAWTWPTFFGVYRDSRTWSSLAYLLLSLGTGILYFTWAITGLSLSIGLIPIVIGLPLLAFFLSSFRALVAFDACMAQATLGIPMGRLALLPTGKTLMTRLGNLFREGRTWTSCAYLILQMPLGILYFTVAITCISTFAGITLTPVAYALMRSNPTPETSWLLEHSFMPLYGPGHPAPMGFVLLVGLLGFLSLTASFHLVLALGWMHGRILKTFTNS